MTVLLLAIATVAGVLVYQNQNKELLTGRYNYNKDNDISYLEIREDGTFDFCVRIEMSAAVNGTYKVEGDYLILNPIDSAPIKFEIKYKSLEVVDGGKYGDKLVLEGMKYEWSTE